MPVMPKTGEITDQLWMRFVTSEWIEGVNQTADTSWKHYGTVKVGDKFILEPIFQFKKDMGNQWSDVTLNWSLDPKGNKSDHLNVGYTLSFNHKTGKYTFN